MITNKASLGNPSFAKDSMSAAYFGERSSAFLIASFCELRPAAACSASALNASIIARVLSGAESTCMALLFA
jgi:hypothetical protein